MATKRLGRSRRADSQVAEKPRRAERRSATVQTRAVRPKTTRVYDTYWRFAAERQAIFLKRASGASAPWTTDPILSEYKFTNAYRASDRVSQFLINHVIYDDNRDFTDTFFRIMLFKVFNRIETWTLLRNSIGEISARDFDIAAFDRILEKEIGSGRRIYSAAYIMPTGGRSVRKHRLHLEMLGQMLRDRLPEKLLSARRMADGFDLLLSYRGVGPFLAYQWITDLNYSIHLSFKEMEFVMPGPGAMDGLRKCFSDPGGLSAPDLIRWVAENQHAEFQKRGISFSPLPGRPLQLIDCQNLFCEVDKYARVKHPEYVGRSGRHKIKQRFKLNPEPIDYSYPPKWGVALDEAAC